MGHHPLRFLLRQLRSMQLAQPWRYGAHESERRNSVRQPLRMTRRGGPQSPVGGGGLLSRWVLAAAGLPPQTRVIGAEPQGADDAYRSLQEGRIISSVEPQTIADGLLTYLGDLTFRIISRHVEQIVTVSEEAIITAMRHVWERMKIVWSALLPCPSLRCWRARSIFRACASE